VTEQFGGQPLGTNSQFHAFSNAGDYRQNIENIEYLLDANPPGQFTRLALTGFIDEVNNTIIYVRSSQDNYKGKKTALENLRKARTSLQLTIDEYDKKTKLYKHIECARQNLEDALTAW
jgi:hypothetical protein